MEKCKRCGLKTVLNDEEIKKAVSQVKAMRGVKLTEECLYNERLTVCKECEKLKYGSTCMSCGCLIEVRALLADGKCPLKKWK